MKRNLAILLLLCVSVASGADWRQFRGNTHNSVVDEKLPTTWDVAAKKNIAWQAELPGRGPSSPILVAGRVIVTASDGPRQDKLFVMCFNAKTGKELWRRHFWATGRTLCHPESSIAAPTPASDGKRIFAFYSSNDLACLDLDGNLLWYRGLAFDYPKAGNDVGMSSSPLVIDDTVVVQVENQGDSFAAGIDTATGEERWRIKRKAAANWTSPTSIKTKAGAHVLLQDIEKVTAVSPRDGQEIWSYKLPANEVTSTVVSGERIYVPANGVTALDVAESPATPALLWDSNQISTSGSTPVVHNGMVYAYNRAGVLTGADAKSGDVQWKLRLKGSAWATPIIAGGHMYIITFDGVAQIVKLSDKPAEEPTLVGSADFGERIQGTPAVGDGALYVRSDKHLWKIAE